MAEYTEPSNEQLAHFMVIYANTDERAAGLNINAYILERIFETNEPHRQMCLKVHRNFQKKMDKLHAKLIAGELGCQHIRANGKPCPNFNEPGSPYCGLHQEQEDE